MMSADEMELLTTQMQHSTSEPKSSKSWFLVDEWKTFLITC